MQLDKTITLHLINSKSYRKTLPFLIAAFFISYFSVLFFFLPVYIAILLGLPSFFLPWVMSYLSKNLRPIGQLTINYKEISITEQGAPATVFPIIELQDFRIIRNATHHQTERELYPPDSHNNWISFSYNQRTFKHEFGITSKKENELFEAVITELRETYADFYYASI